MGLFTNYHNHSDEELMILVKRGDHRAFSLLYDRYAKRLKAYFHRMLWSNAAMAEDHVQELFTKIVNKPELFQSSHLFKPWVFRIAANMCKNSYRKRAFEKEYLEQLQKQQIYHSVAERKIDEQIQLDFVTGELEKLTEDRRSLFLLRYQQELSIEELSVLFDLPMGTVKSRLHHIRKDLIASMNATKKEKK